jgi:hypothetical protein
VDSAEGRPLFDGERRWRQSTKIVLMAQSEPDRFDFGSRARAQVRDGAMFDFAVFAIGLPQQIAGICFVALANLRDVDVHCGYTMHVYCRLVNGNNRYVSGYILGIKTAHLIVLPKTSSTERGNIRFKWKDYRIEGRERYRVMTLDTHDLPSR